MSAYEPLLELKVDHAFYAGGQCRGLAFQPSPGTVRQLQRGGCVWQGSDSGLVVHAERARIERFFGAGGEPFALGFVATARHPAFAAVTEGLPGATGGCFLIERTLPAGGGAVEWEATAQDIAPLHSPRWAALLAPMPPVSLAFGLHLEFPDAAPRRCRIRLPARALRWAYFLVGDWPREGVYLADADGALEFSALQPQRLPNGQEVLCARSKAAIVLSERAPQHIQLRRRVNGGERVLVKRLPVAAPGVWGLLPDGGGLVAEIYVNR